MDEIDLYRQELAQQVEIAFSDVPYPGDDNIAKSPNTSLSSGISTLFVGKNWQEVPLSSLFQERLSLGLFTPEAFCYFFPAFLRAVLLHSDQMDTLWENLFFDLTPPENEIKMGVFLDKVSRFNQQQIEVIKAFIKLYISIERSYPDPKRERASDFWMQR